MEEGMKEGERGGEDHETLKPRLSSILYLTLSASIGGLVFGYYVGFIIARFGVLTYDDSILGESIQTGFVGAILGATVGGLMNDCLGRKSSILIADSLVLIGGVSHMLPLTSGHDKYSLGTIGNMFIALGVGMISMTSPLYISEFSPAKIRDIFVSINFIFYGIGKFTFLYLYIIDSARTTNYIIALAGIPALFQFCLMFSLPETPMWLYKKDREEDAIKALKNIYTCCGVEEDFSFRLSIKRETVNKDEISYSGSSIISKIRSSWSSHFVRKQFVVGTFLQVVKHLVGMNALMYCASSIDRMCGFGASYPRNDTPVMKEALAVSHGVASVFAGFYCTLILVAGFGKRKILCWSMYCMLGGALCLSFVFIVSPNTTEVVSRSESTMHSNNHKYNIFRQLILLSYHFYCLYYSAGLEIVPWIINSQMYPTEVRGLYGGMAATANWIFFLVIIILSFFFTNTQGPQFTILLISSFCVIVSWLIKKLLE